MLDKPARLCAGCPLFPLSTGFMRPSLARDGYGIALLGEALGEQEAELGSPFVGKAGFMLTRLIEWAGLNREKFDIYNAVWCRPPDNRLEGQPYETGAIDHCKAHHWGALLQRPRVVVPLGNVALSALTGTKGILLQRGYVQPGGGFHIIPTLHPAFLVRGQSKYTAAVIHDLQKAHDLAVGGLPIEPTDYVLRPSPEEALRWARDVAGQADDHRYLSFDIETLGKGDDEGELETGEDEPDYSWIIERIGFSCRGFTALTVPFTPEYFPCIRILLEAPIEKVVWNAGFDVPRLARAGFPITGPIHDGMVAWHILHSDLPKGLGFVATFTCPWQPRWKHLSGAMPEHYNAVDADVELRSMIKIEEELKRTGLWRVYERDVLQIDPILAHMSSCGMPVDSNVRGERAASLASALSSTMQQLEAAVPISARRYAPKQGFVRDPTDTTGLIQLRLTLPGKFCSRCGLSRPGKAHFKTLKKPTVKRPQNPCAGATVVERVGEVTRYARLEPFKPSREQLIRYQESLGRPVPSVWDKREGRRKLTMNEAAIKKLMLTYKDDLVYKLSLEYREMDKLAGTYIGRPQ